MEGWPINHIPAELRQVQISGLEMLLVSASIDFSTLAKHATEELLLYLSNGQQVILAESGHMDYDSLQPEVYERRSGDQSRLCPG